MGKFPDGGALLSGGRIAVLSCTGTSGDLSFRSLPLIGFDMVTQPTTVIVGYSFSSSGCSRNSSVG
jgi:hypothetical protein